MDDALQNSSHVTCRWRRALSRPSVLLALVLAVSLVGCTRYVRTDDLAEEYFNLGNAFYDLEDYATAEAYYLRALELDPDLERASFNLGRSLAEQELYDEAADVLQRLLPEDPDNLRILEAIAYVEYRRGNVDKAIEDYEAVLAVSPFRIDALYNLGLIHLEADRELDARDYLERAYEVSPEDQDVLFSYAQSLFETGREQAGLGILDDLREIDDLPPEYLRGAAQRYEDAEFYADALVLYDRLLAEQPDDAGALFGKGRILLTAAEEGDGGIAALTEALEAGFEDEEAARQLVESEELIRAEDVRALFARYGVSTEMDEAGAPEAGDSETADAENPDVEDPEP